MIIRRLLYSPTRQISNKEEFRLLIRSRILAVFVVIPMQDGGMGLVVVEKICWKLAGWVVFIIGEGWSPELEVFKLRVE